MDKYSYYQTACEIWAEKVHERNLSGKSCKYPG